MVAYLLVGWPVYVLARALQAANRRRLTHKLCGWLIGRAPLRRSLRADRLRAAALVTDALALGELDDVGGSIAANETVIREYGSARDEVLRTHVAWAMVNEGWDLVSTGRLTEGISLFQRLIEVIPTSQPFVQPFAQGLMNLGLALGREGNQLEEMSVYDQIIASLGEMNDPGSDHFIAWALLNKAIVLREQGRYSDALRLCETVLDRWWNRSDSSMAPRLREALGAAQRNRADMLRSMGQFEAAISAAQRLRNRYLSSNDPGLAEEVAWAMLTEAASYESLGRKPDAERTYDLIVSRFRRSPVKEVKAAVAAAKRLREGLDV